LAQSLINKRPAKKEKKRPKEHKQMDNKTWQEKVEGMIADIKAQVAQSTVERRYDEMLENLLHELMSATKERIDVVNKALSNALEAMKGTVDGECSGLFAMGKASAEKDAVVAGACYAAAEKVEQKITASIQEINTVLGDK
jgi:ferritin-like metal-binding protein YciE